MLIWTAKINRKKLTLTLAAAVVLCGALVAASLMAGQGAAATAAERSPKGIKTAEDRTAYLQSWGWVVGEDAVSVEELELPREFGSEYDEYLSLQSSQGFDLTRYAGKRVKRYTYDILNYPSGEQGVQAHLLMFRNTVIGGEVQGEGFLHGLAMPG